MSINTVTVRARTRGRAGKEFTHVGVGKIEERNVAGKEGPIVVDKDGKELEYSYAKDGKVVSSDGITQNDKGELVLPTGARYLVVDDVDASGTVNVEQNPAALQEVVDFINANRSIIALDEKTSALQFVIDGVLNWFNVQARKVASPTVTVDATDELTPLVSDMIAAGIMKAEDEKAWRTGIAYMRKMEDDLSKTDAANRTKQVKALRKLQKAA